MMDRNQLIELLPCFVCGDLPAEVMAQVQAAVDSDPELAELVALLGESNDLCRQELAQPAPVGLEVPVEDDQVTRGWALVVGLACAALFALALLLPHRSAELPEFQDDLTHAVAVTNDLHLDRLEGWVAADSAGQLQQAFLDGGLTMPMAMVADLTGIGLEVVGGVAHANGTIVSYVNAQGDRIDCHMTGVLPVQATATEVLAAPTAGKPDLQVFDLHGASAVLWQDGDMICVLSTRGDVDALLAVARVKVWGVTG